jgi:hypothetical protein
VEQAIAAAAATGLPGLASPSKSRISDALSVFQQHLAEQRGLGVSAKDFAAAGGVCAIFSRGWLSAPPLVLLPRQEVTELLNTETRRRPELASLLAFFVAVTCKFV